MLALMLLLAAAADPTSIAGGTLCIARIGHGADPCPARQPDEAGDPCATFEVFVGDRPPVLVSWERGALVEGLDRHVLHAVRIHRDGRRTESFRLSFEDLGTGRLCLSYGPSYDTWMLDAVQPGTDFPCRCDLGGEVPTPERARD